MRLDTVLPTILMRFVLSIALICSGLSVPKVQAGEMVVPLMPVPGTMVNLSSAFIPVRKPVKFTSQTDSWLPVKPLDAFHLNRS